MKVIEMEIILNFNLSDLSIFLFSFSTGENIARIINETTNTPL